MEIRDTRNGEWFWVYTALLADPHLFANDKLVYSAISTFGGHQVIHPTLQQIAERCGASERGVRVSLRKLEEVGYLSIDGSTGRGNANVYYLLKKPKGCNLCPLYKDGNEQHEKGQPITLKAATIAPHIDKKDKIYISATRENDYEVEGKYKAPPKYPHSKEVFSWFPKPEKSWALNTTELKHSELLWERGEIAVKRALKYHQAHKEDEGYGYVVVKPSQLEGKWNDIAEYARRTK